MIKVLKISSSNPALTHWNISETITNSCKALGVNSLEYNEDDDESFILMSGDQGTLEAISLAARISAKVFGANIEELKDEN